ncbi:hypothetical protein VP01_243g4 [Puccinia sorghi]|uniref:Uncharacterized protein n=1 Tax=Puccinia sorghi TaxID=27349 RepID=A0A0L6V6F0_9BASI|nr:hypothetical protein VP01_243g4 [Puccinia sorghi]
MLISTASHLISLTWPRNLGQDQADPERRASSGHPRIQECRSGVAAQALMASASRKLFNIPPESWSSEDELSAPATISVSSRNRIIQERERTLKSINAIEQLAKNRAKVIECLNQCDALITTEHKAACAREIVQQFRRDTLYHHQAGGRAEWRTSTHDDSSTTRSPGLHPQPFDRLIYLLDRYTQYCSAIGLSPWPVHHLKVALWVKGDVISLKTRVIPLQKTVRCYITSMETVRLKTRDLFSPSYQSDHDPLMSCPILKELLGVLPVSRAASSGNPTPEAENRLTGGVDRDTVLCQIKSQSGDSMAEEALHIVQASRMGGSSGAERLRYGKKKPDPHLHTLSRYMQFCRSLCIPMWPIEPIRVALWLRESVLSPASPDYTGFKVSLRTVQVYLSRLEYARVRTESLFMEEFGQLATGSLYRNPAIGDILQSFNPNQAKKLDIMTDAFRLETGSSPPPQVLRKRKLASQLSLEEVAAHYGYRNCRPKVSAARSSLADLCSESGDSGSEAEYLASSSGSDFPSHDDDSMLSYKSPAPTSCEQECFLDSSSSHSGPRSHKGRISYILCTESSPDPHVHEKPYEREQSAAADSPPSIISSSNSPPPAQWSVPPINIPRIPNCQLRFTIPSFDSFSFASSQ